MRESDSSISTPPKKAQNSVFRYLRLHVSLLTASLVLAVAALLWFSWQSRAFVFIKPLPHFRGIVPWTILLDFTLGMGLFLLAWRANLAKARLFQSLAKLCGVLALLGAVAFLAEFLCGHSFGNLDQWWFRGNMVLLDDAKGGLPAPQTSITILFFCGGSICCLHYFKMFLGLSILRPFLRGRRGLCRFPGLKPRADPIAPSEQKLALFWGLLP